MWGGWPCIGGAPISGLGGVLIGGGGKGIPEIGGWELAGKLKKLFSSGFGSGGGGKAGTKKGLIKSLYDNT